MIHCFFGGNISYLFFEKDGEGIGGYISFSLPLSTLLFKKITEKKENVTIRKQKWKKPNFKTFL
jgi:hypothetical protein